MSDETVHYSDFRRDSAENLLSYISKEQGATLHNRDGRAAKPKDVERFVERSERYEMSRHMVLSADNAEQLSRDELEEVADQVLRDELGNRSTVDYLYSVEIEDGDRKHVHVAATGKADNPGDPLWLDQDELEDIRSKTHEIAQKKEKERSLVQNRIINKTVAKGMGK